MPVKKEIKKESTVKRLPSTAKKAESGSPREAGSRKLIGLSVPMVNIGGKDVGILALPKEIFGAKINKPLLSQALRVYLNNATAHHSNTKTRGEVKGSTRKIRAQKGTGGARHGSVRAPIFVGGGISLGPKYRKVILDLPKKMKKAALISALSEKVHDSEIMGITGLEKITGKTKEMHSLAEKMQKKSLLIVTGEKNEALRRAVGNLSNVNSLLADQLSVMDLIKYQTVMMTKEAVKNIEGRIKSEKVEESPK